MTFRKGGCPCPAPGIRQKGSIRNRLKLQALHGSCGWCRHTATPWGWSRGRKKWVGLPDFGFLQPGGKELFLGAHSCCYIWYWPMFESKDTCLTSGISVRLWEDVIFLSLTDISMAIYPSVVAVHFDKDPLHPKMVGTLNLHGSAHLCSGSYCRELPRDTSGIISPLMRSNNCWRCYDSQHLAFYSCSTSFEFSLPPSHHMKLLQPQCSLPTTCLGKIPYPKAPRSCHLFGPHPSTDLQPLGIQLVQSKPPQVSLAGWLTSLLWDRLDIHLHMHCLHHQDAGLLESSSWVQPGLPHQVGWWRPRWQTEAQKLMFSKWLGSLLLLGRERTGSDCMQI